MKYDKLKKYGMDDPAIGDDCEMYRVKDVDETIAELEAENKRLKATPEQIMKEVFDKCLIYPKEMVRLDDAYKLAVSLRKQKYKRCLAMAEWCDSNCDWYYSIGEEFIDRVDFYRKWRDRWFEIAEHFKEKT